jgi:hypothetical protein
VKRATLDLTGWWPHICALVVDLRQQGMPFLERFAWGGNDAQPEYIGSKRCLPQIDSLAHYWDTDVVTIIVRASDLTLLRLMAPAGLKIAERPVQR